MQHPQFRPLQYRLAQNRWRQLGIGFGAAVVSLGVALGAWQAAQPRAVTASLGGSADPAALARRAASELPVAAAAQVVGASAARAVPPATAEGTQAAPPQPLARVQPGSNLQMGEFFVHVPPTVQGRLRVLVALHGMGGAGEPFCEAILQRTDSEQWLVVAPTYAYGDWRDPNVVTREESSRFIPRLHEFLKELPQATGLDLEPGAVLLGYSRGAQLAQRFAMVYPEQTRAVAAISAGTYTLPHRSLVVDGQPVPLNYPFGTADLRERFGREFDAEALRAIPFWVGVGANDSNPADLPRQWDPFLGTNRVVRAESFARRVAEAGATVQLIVFPGVDHAVGEDIRAQALDFLASVR